MVVVAGPVGGDEFAVVGGLAFGEAGCLLRVALPYPFQRFGGLAGEALGVGS